MANLSHARATSAAVEMIRLHRSVAVVRKFGSVLSCGHRLGVVYSGKVSYVLREALLAAAFGGVVGLQSRLGST